MTTALDVGKKLVALVNQGKSQEAHQTLYSPAIVSIEAAPGPSGSPRSEGMAAVNAKGEWWRSNHTIHSAKASGPWPHGDRFIVRFSYDITATSGPMKGKRFTMEEAGLYTVRNGKVVHEEFFYDMGG